MSFVFWIAAAWFGISVAGAFAVAAFIRDNRGVAGPLVVQPAGSRRTTPLRQPIAPAAFTSSEPSTVTQSMPAAS